MNFLNRLLGSDVGNFPILIKRRPVILLCLAGFIVASSIWIFVEWFKTGGGLFAFAVGISCLIYALSELVAWKKLVSHKGPWA